MRHTPGKWKEHAALSGSRVAGRADSEWWEEVRAKQAAEARALGDAYLKYWAAWAHSDPCQPRLARSSVIYLGRYDEPEKLKTRPEAVGDWMDDLADAVGCMVLALPPAQREAILALYMRIWIRPESNLDRGERIRAWTSEGIIEQLNDLRETSPLNLKRIPERTFYRRIEHGRGRIEDLCEQSELPAPPII